MKPLHRVIPIWMLIIILAMATLTAQRAEPPAEFAGMDLEKVKQAYQRAIRKGEHSYTINYAEALFYAGYYSEATDMYAEADALQLIATDHQRRNYVHAAIRASRQSPYNQDTGYFHGEWAMNASIMPFCSNSSNEDFAPFYWNNMLFITSSRNLSTGRYSFTRKPFLNVHAFINDCIEIDLPPILPSEINTARHDGPIAISGDGRLVFVTRNHERVTTSGFYNLHIDFYQLRSGAWVRERMFPHIGSDYSVQHPFYYNTDSTLYFSSNIPGGFGGFDLYKSKWDGSSWSQPENLGETINTVYDEVFPSFNPQGHLIYASNHIETTGGMDLVLYHNEKRYLLPEPFNTINDDFAICFKDRTSGYFTSNRELTGFNDNIFTFSVEAFVPPIHDFFAEVVDKDTGESLDGVEVSFNSAAAQARGVVLTDIAGMGFLYSGSDQKYLFSFGLNHPDYEPVSISSADFRDRNGRYVVTLMMERAGKLVIEKDEFLSRGYSEVYFDNDQPEPSSTSTTTSHSYEYLYYMYAARKPQFHHFSIDGRSGLDAFFMDVDQGMTELRQLAAHLLSELRAGKHYTVIFTSHASPLAGSDYNMWLSQRRFVSVMNYFRHYQGGALAGYIDSGTLQYRNNPMGDLQSVGRVSDNRQDPSRSIYSVEASRERKVTISWQSREAGEQVNLPALEIINRQPEQEILPQINTGGYYVIIGSFPTVGEAEKHVTDLRRRGFPECMVLPEAAGRRFRVSYGKYDSFGEATKAMQRAMENIVSDAWLLEQ